MGSAYAVTPSFWVAVLFSGVLQGIVLGCVGLGFFVAYEELQNATWNDDMYSAALSSTSTGSENNDVQSVLGLGNGQWWYVGLLAAGGAAVGCVKSLWTILVGAAFPAKPAGFLQDLRDLKPDDPYECIPVLACSILSIGCGASCGPEMALGGTGVAFGGAAIPAVARWLGQRLPASIMQRLLLDLSSGQNEQRRLSALDGMAGALGALFPSQFLSPMLLHELGRHWGAGRGSFDFMETVTRTGIAASVSYAIFVGLKDRTILDTVEPPQAAYDSISSIDVVYLFYGAVLGVICGFASLFGFILLAMGGKLGSAVCSKIDQLGIGSFERRAENDSSHTISRTHLGMIATPAIGGSLIGLLAVACPLTLGDGSLQLGGIITHAESLGADTLIVSAIVKLVAVSLSLGFGFIGGQIFPFIFTGVCIGTAAHVLVPDIPLLIAFPACMVATPSAFLPALYTFTTTASLALALGGPATAPVFVAPVFSFSVVCGAGLLQGMVTRSLAKDEAKAEIPSSSVTE